MIIRRKRPKKVVFESASEEAEYRRLEAKFLEGLQDIPTATELQVPKGDVRLTLNISKEHHKALKTAAFQLETTMGELVEMLIDKHLRQ